MLVHVDIRDADEASHVGHDQVLSVVGEGDGQEVVQQVALVRSDLNQFGLVVLLLHPQGHATVGQGGSSNLVDALFQLRKLDLENECN